MEALLKTKKIMTKEEVALFVNLVQSHPLLTIKLTNAATNKQKEATWTKVTDLYNSRTRSIHRSKAQLKLKWDNLKKAARKRAQIIKMSQLQTGEGISDVSLTDDILDKVTSIMCKSIDSTSLVENSNIIENSNSSSSFNVDAGTDEKAETLSNVKREVFVNVEMPNYDNSSSEESSSSEDLPLYHLGLPSKKGKRKDPTGLLARNLAIANFYKMKTEKTKIEIELLKAKYEKKLKQLL